MKAVEKPYLHSRIRTILPIGIAIDFQKIHFARQQGGDHTVVYLRPITPRNYFSESLYLAQAQPDVIQKLTSDLRFRLPGFHTLRLKDAGEGKILYASFESDVGKKSIDIPFGQISEGQKALIGLYAALYGLFSDNDATLCVDEPENFLALPEVQPWLDRLYEMCQEETRQGLIISHHPCVLNFLAADTGIWFERSNGTGPTRNWAISLNADSLISVDQLIERGWIDGVSK